MILSIVACLSLATALPISKHNDVANAFDFVAGAEHESQSSSVKQSNSFDREASFDAARGGRHSASLCVKWYEDGSCSEYSADGFQSAHGAESVHQSSSFEQSSSSSKDLAFGSAHEFSNERDCRDNRRCDGSQIKSGEFGFEHERQSSSFKQSSSFDREASFGLIEEGGRYPVRYCRDDDYNGQCDDGLAYGFRDRSSGSESVHESSSQEQSSSSSKDRTFGIVHELNKSPSRERYCKDIDYDGKCDDAVYYSFYGNDGNDNNSFDDTSRSDPTDNSNNSYDDNSYGTDASDQPDSYFDGDYSYGDSDSLSDPSDNSYGDSSSDPSDSSYGDSSSDPSTYTTTDSYA
eukprot:jgi/Hompol1/3239/HPOL_003186-RA